MPAKGSCRIEELVCGIFVKQSHNRLLSKCYSLCSTNIVVFSERGMKDILGRCRCLGPMVPRSNGSAYASVQKGSGTCSSVSLCLRGAPPQTARPATSIATLRCETVSEQVRHRLTDAPRSIGPRLDTSALIRERGQETVVGQAAHRLLLVHHPQPLKGRIITREK